MCAFHRTDLPSTNGISDAKSPCNIQPTASSLYLPPFRSIDPLQQSTTHPAQGPEFSAQRPVLALPPIAQSPIHLDGTHDYCGPRVECHVRNQEGSGASGLQTSLLLHASHPSIATSASHRLISAGRNKREVRRRTKTGCRTCRKRRIKVSHQLSGETHVMEQLMCLVQRKSNSCRSWHLTNYSASLARRSHQDWLAFLRQVEKKIIVVVFTH